MSTLIDRTSGVIDAVAEKLAVVAATNTNVALLGLAPIGGYTPKVRDRILVNAQTNAAQNGIYLASASAWTRSQDFNSGKNIAPGTSFLLTDGGTAAIIAMYVLNPEIAVPIVVGTTPITFTSIIISKQVTLTAITNVAAIPAVSGPGNNQAYALLNYATSTDLGGGLLRYNSSNTATVDNGMVFNGPAGAGRYLRFLYDSAHTSYFGVDHTGGGTNASQLSAMNKCFTFAKNNNLPMTIDGGNINMHGLDVGADPNLYWNNGTSASGTAVNSLIIKGSGRKTPCSISNCMIHLGSIPAEVKIDGVTSGGGGGATGHHRISDFQIIGGMCGWNWQTSNLFESLLISPMPLICGDASIRTTVAGSYTFGSGQYEGFGLSMWQCSHVIFLSCEIVHGKDNDVPNGRCNGVRATDSHEITFSGGLIAHHVDALVSCKFVNMEAANAGFVTNGACNQIILDVHMEGNERTNGCFQDAAVNSFLSRAGFYRNQLEEWNTVASGSAAITIPASFPADITVAVPAASILKDPLGGTVTLTAAQSIELIDRASTFQASTSKRYIAGTVTSYAAGSLVMHVTSGSDGGVPGNLGFWRLADMTGNSYPCWYFSSGCASVTFTAGYHVGPPTVAGTWCWFGGNGLTAGSNWFQRFAQRIRLLSTALNYYTRSLNVSLQVTADVQADVGASVFGPPLVPTTIANNATYVFNAASGDFQKLTLQGANVMGAPIGFPVGWEGDIVFGKTANGDSVTWNANWVFDATLFPAGAPTLAAQTAAQTSLYRFKSLVTGKLRAIAYTGPA